jgi:hypothetical protein
MLSTQLKEEKQKNPSSKKMNIIINDNISPSTKNIRTNSFECEVKPESFNPNFSSSPPENSFMRKLEERFKNN